MVTVDCGCTGVPCAGFCETTMPLGIVGSVGRQLTGLAPSPTFSSETLASCLLEPVTLGTGTVDGPDETVSVTVLLCPVLLPGAGDEEITSPLGTVSLDV